MVAVKLKLRIQKQAHFWKAASNPLFPKITRKSGEKMTSLPHPPSLSIPPPSLLSPLSTKASFFIRDKLRLTTTTTTTI